jgi:hypothetical protein
LRKTTIKANAAAAEIEIIACDRVRLPEPVL